jgi:hypothetical protein
MVRRDEEPARGEVPLVRIFLSSPGDVPGERTSARHLIDSELPKLPYFRAPHRHEERSSAAPMPTVVRPQLATLSA